MKTEKLLLEMSALHGVAGREDKAVEYAGRILREYGPVSITPLGSLICRVREPREGRPHVMLDAHIDEIGLIVTAVTEEGFLRVAACGGIDRRLLLAASVTVHTRDEALAGVVCSVPPHLSDGEGKTKKPDEIYIDVGLSREQASARILPGDIVTINSASKALLGGYVSGKAMDNRAGCVVHMLAAGMLKDKKLNCGLTITLNTMEEIGGGPGAVTAAYEVNPTHAVSVDVSFAHTPDAPKHKTGLVKKGPMIGIAPILSGEVYNRLIDVAKEKEIPYQLEVMGGKTSTNADGIAVSRNGIRTGLISVPEKYMHTPIETVAVEDVENAARLVAAYVESL